MSTQQNDVKSIDAESAPIAWTTSGHMVQRSIDDSNIGNIIAQTVPGKATHPNHQQDESLDCGGHRLRT